jgi:hypothetical protein
MQAKKLKAREEQVMEPPGQVVGCGKVVCLESHHNKEKNQRKQLEWGLGVCSSSPLTWLNGSNGWAFRRGAPTWIIRISLMWL